MNPSFSSTNQPKPYTATKLGATKAKRKDRHMKVNGRESRVRISKACAPRVFQLSEVLGHRTTAQTIEWLLEQAEPAVNEVLGTTTPTVHAKVAIPNSTAITPRSAAISPPQLPPLPASLTSSVSLEAGGLQPVVERDGSATADGDFMFNLSSSGNGEPELSIDDYTISIPIFPYL